MDEREKQPDGDEIMQFYKFLNFLVMIYKTRVIKNKL